MTQKKFYLVIIFSLFFSYAQADIIYVDKDANPHPTGNDGTSWAKAYTSLATALSSASFGDIIRMDKGIYINPSVGLTLKDGVKIYGGYNVRYNNGVIVPDGLINATRFITLPGSAAPITNIRCHSNSNIGSNGRTFSAFSNLSSETILDGLTLSFYTSGIHLGNITQFDMLLNNCIFLGTDPTVPSVAIADLNNDIFSGSFSPMINNCVIESPMGIALTYHQNSNHVIGINLSITRSKFECSASGIQIITNSLASGAAYIDITESYFSSTGLGAGLNIELDNVSSEIKVNNCLFTAAPTSKMAIYLNSNISLVVNNSTFYECQALTSKNNTVPSIFNNCILWTSTTIIEHNVARVGLNDCLIKGKVCPTNNQGGGPISCSNCIYNKDPQFISINPTSSDYLKPSATSPARNAGNNIYTSATGRAYGGNDRILEGTVDIGAYEFCPNGTICNAPPTNIGGGTRGPVPKIATKNIENNIENLLVYPNPAKDVVKVKSSDKILSIEILNTQGQVISSSQDSNSVELSNVAKGMYLLRITTDEGIQTKRIIKE